MFHDDACEQTLSSLFVEVSSVSGSSSLMKTAVAGFMRIQLRL
jgi:hypothetical protein